MKEQFYFERTVFLRCAANGNPPVRYTWRRGHEVLSQGSDAGVEIYEPFFTQVSKGRRWVDGGCRPQPPPVFCQNRFSSSEALRIKDLL